ncbi:MAG: hypothetical protein PHN38_02735 [Sulfurospirillaceae bacterium]|nr:hypothetical protein [Sulfurospirillaceae bacterium]
MRPKIVLLLLFFALTLFAQNPFKETRYIYAIDKTLLLEGYITFGEQNVIIEYTKPQPKVLTYFEGGLSIQDENGYTATQLNANSAMNYFFMIIKAIEENNDALLESFFTSKTDAQTTILEPKDTASQMVQEVKITKNGNKLKSLHVELKNGDRITIETVD